MKRHVLIPCLTIVLTALCATTPASAGIITGIHSTSLPGASTGTLGPTGLTPVPNNDDATAASPNTIPYTIFFNAGGLEFAEYEFAVADTGGVTEYLFNGNMLVNNTGQPWTHFRFELGFGTGANFTRSSSLDLLDFDAPDFTPGPTAVGFTTLAHTSDLLQWSGGTVNSIGVARFSFSIDVPDGLAAVNPNGVNRFTLRQSPGVGQVPTVPEPATMLLLGAGLLGSGARLPPLRCLATDAARVARRALQGLGRAEGVRYADRLIHGSRTTLSTSLTTRLRPHCRRTRGRRFTAGGAGRAIQGGRSAAGGRTAAAGRLSG